MKTKFQQLLLLKQKAADHINQKKYSWAVVYLCDILKQFQTAIEEIDNAEQMQRAIREIKLPCHKNLSLCYLKQGNYSQCIGQCLQVLQIQPNSIKMLYRIGLSHMNTNNLQQSENYLKQAFLLDPNEKQVMKALERLENLNNVKKRRIIQPKDQQQNKLTLTTIMKFMFLWPFLLMAFMYRTYVTSKKKAQ